MSIVHQGRVIVPSAALPRPRFHYSPVVQAGGFVFVSGLIGLVPATAELVTGGARAEVAQILRNLSALLAEKGWSLQQLVMARVYCGPNAVANEVNLEWDAFFGDMEPPARTFVGVRALPLDASVEIEFQLVL